MYFKTGKERQNLAMLLPHLANIPSIEKEYDARRIADATPIEKTFPSCEPGKFKLCKLNVVRWIKRIPQSGKLPKIPTHLKLAILTRGRIRLPFNSIKWLLKIGRKSGLPQMFWGRRLPPNFKLKPLIPEVDVTIELFIVQKKLSTSWVTYILGKYLEQRHIKEIKNCNQRFLFAWDSIALKGDFERKLSTGCPKKVSLDRIFTRANLKMPDKLSPPFLKKFILVVYVSFPNDIELFLKPKPPKDPPPERRLDNHLRKSFDDYTFMESDEDQELLCLIERLLSGANDEYTFSKLVDQYKDGLQNGFIVHLRNSLKLQLKKWKGTNITKFIRELRKLNLEIHKGLVQIERWANDDIEHSNPKVIEMFKWRNRQLKNSKSILHCYNKLL